MVLNEILRRKRFEVADLKKKKPLLQVIEEAARYRNDKRSFKKAISDGKKTHLICELKKASPSEGVLREHFRVKDLAYDFEHAGASALSVLTEMHYFLGHPTYIKEAKEVVKIPVLRKDFIVDPYQVYESVTMGADAFLIIVHILKDKEIKELLKLANKLKIDALVEVHTKDELSRAVNLGSEIIGINNRNLGNLKTDLGVSEKLISYIPKGIVKVVESGIKSRQDIERYQKLNVNAFLIGTSLMKSRNARQKIRELKG